MLISSAWTLLHSVARGGSVEAVQVVLGVLDLVLEMLTGQWQALAVLEN